MVFLALLLIPVLIAGAAFFFSSKITWREFLLQLVIQLVIAAASAWIVFNQSVGDVELLNARVVRKYRDTVSCSHSYQCHPHQVTHGTGKDKYTTTEYDTCYEHSHDYDWVVASTIGSVDIDRIDRQGVDEPPRFTAAIIGEPFSLPHSYDNYVKGAPGTLLKRQGLVERYARALPEYPIHVFDYYRSNRLVLINGAHVADPGQWNHDLSEINADLGARKQANMIVVLVKGLSQDYVYALEEKWILGKKNDVILVVGVDYVNTPQWAYVMAWTHQELIKVSLRDAIMDLPSIERESTLAIFRREVAQKFVREPMKDFEYLKASIVPTTTQWVVSLLIGLLVALGVAYWVHKEDVL
jgi:hypothetical protein